MNGAPEHMWVHWRNAGVPRLRAFSAPLGMTFSQVGEPVSSLLAVVAVYGDVAGQVECDDSELGSGAVWVDGDDMLMLL
jgi:hypothetical protein